MDHLTNILILVNFSCCLGLAAMHVYTITHLFKWLLSKDSSLTLRIVLIDNLIMATILLGWTWTAFSFMKNPVLRESFNLVTEPVGVLMGTVGLASSFVVLFVITRCARREDHKNRISLQHYASLQDRSRKYIDEYDSQGRSRDYSASFAYHP